MTAAARLPAELVGPPSALVVGAAALVLLAGLLAAARAPGQAGASFAPHARLTLDLLLAAGLIRLASADGYRALLTVAVVVALRQVLARGVRFGAAASAA